MGENKQKPSKPIIKGIESKPLAGSEHPRNIVNNPPPPPPPRNK